MLKYPKKVNSVNNIPNEILLKISLINAILQFEGSNLP